MNIVSGLVFGIVGMWLIKQAKARGNFAFAGIGVVLMVYPYFVDNGYLSFGLGLLLCYAAWFLR